MQQLLPPPREKIRLNRPEAAFVQNVIRLAEDGRDLQTQILVRASFTPDLYFTLMKRSGQTNITDFAGWVYRAYRDHFG